MRERHFPRLCRTCRAPMARQEDTCWRCGTRWGAEAEPPTRLTLIAGGLDGWTNEGGSFEAAVAVALRDRSS